MIKTREFILEKDYNVIAPWFTSHGWPTAPDATMLSTTGIIAEDEHGPIGVAFVYVTNSPIAFLEWVCVRPEIGIKVSKVIKALIDGTKPIVEQFHIARLMHLTNPKFSGFLQSKFGFEYSETMEVLFLNTEVLWQPPQQ